MRVARQGAYPCRPTYSLFRALFNDYDPIRKEVIGHYLTVVGCAGQNEEDNYGFRANRSRLWGPRFNSR
jgi:hypothetical protein